MSKLPDQRDIKSPLFSHVAVTGEISATDGYDFVMRHYNLSESALRLKDKSGEPKLHNRVRWACRALREDGLFERSHGVWKLTKSAKSRLAMMAQALVG